VWALGDADVEGVFGGAVAERARVLKFVEATAVQKSSGAAFATLWALGGSESLGVKTLNREADDDEATDEGDDAEYLIRAHCLIPTEPRDQSHRVVDADALIGRANLSPINR
jgi:hypothetical protein